MSKKTREIKGMTGEELVVFLKSAAKNFKLAGETMEKNYEKGMKSILDFWENR